jgi:hypothetical protein
VSHSLPCVCDMIVSGVFTRPPAEGRGVIRVMRMMMFVTLLLLLLLLLLLKMMMMTTMARLTITPLSLPGPLCQRTDDLSDALHDAGHRQHHGPHHARTQPHEEPTHPCHHTS